MYTVDDTALVPDNTTSTQSQTLKARAFHEREIMPSAEIRDIIASHGEIVRTGHVRRLPLGNTHNYKYNEPINLYTKPNRRCGDDKYITRHASNLRAFEFQIQTQVFRLYIYIIDLINEWGYGYVKLLTERRPRRR